MWGPPAALHPTPSSPLLWGRWRTLPPLPLIAQVFAFPEVLPWLPLVLQGPCPQGLRRGRARVRGLHGPQGQLLQGSPKGVGASEVQGRPVGGAGLGGDPGTPAAVCRPLQETTGWPRPHPRAGINTADKQSALLTMSGRMLSGWVQLFQKRAIFCYRRIRFLLQIGLWQEPAVRGVAGRGRLIFRTCSQRVAVGEVVLAGPVELGLRLLGPGHLECGRCVVPRVREAAECQACPAVLGMLPGMPQGQP